MEKYKTHIINRIIAITACFILILNIISCGRDDISSIEYYSNVPDVRRVIEPSESSISGVSLVPIKVDSMETSFIGHFWIKADTLYFTDQYYLYVYSMRTDGSIIGRHVGKGRGPGEVPFFHFCVPFSDGYYMYAGSNASYRFDSKWRQTGVTPVHWGGKNYSEAKRKMNRPNPAETIFYQEDASFSDHIQQWDSTHVAMYVSCGLPKFNHYMNAELFYGYSRIIALVNVQTGYVDRVFGRRSPVFLEKSNIPAFNSIGFAQTDDAVFVSFFPDSTIYILDKEIDQAIGKFGRQGRNMNTAYIRTYTLEDGYERERVDLNIFGYYSYLKYDKKRKLLFRGYSQGEHSQYDGLQIYKNNALIGDVDVPKGFSIVGYCNGQLIAAIEDKEIKELALHFYFVNFIE